MAFFCLFLNCDATKIIITSIPKCGTHLVDKCVGLLTKKNNSNLLVTFVQENQLIKFDENKEYLVSHVSCYLLAKSNIKNQKYKCLFIYRDPRDQIVSDIFWDIRNETKNKVVIETPFKDRLKSKIEGIVNLYKRFTPWLKEQYCYSMKFEDLIGQKGGGDDIVQRKVINEICKYLELKCNKKLIDHCINNLFGGTHTFREGKIGGWKKYFLPEHVTLFKEQAGQLLIDLGYEKDLNW